MKASSSDRNFTQYNAAQEGRDVRPLARAAVAAARPTGDATPKSVPGPTDVPRPTGARSTDAVGARRVAIELGCGRGIETRYLAESGYTVHAYDMDLSVVPEMDALAADLPVKHTTVDLAEITVLPSADLILACATLPFVPRASFNRLWQAMRDALRPGGILAVDLFGDRDDWAGIDGTFLARADVETLLEDVEVLSLQEGERDGASLQGPKHWHTYQVLARKREHGSLA